GIRAVPYSICYLLLHPYLGAGKSWLPDLPQYVVCNLPRTASLSQFLAAPGFVAYLRLLSSFHMGLPSRHRMQKLQSRWRPSVVLTASILRYALMMLCSGP